MNTFLQVAFKQSHLKSPPMPSTPSPLVHAVRALVLQFTSVSALLTQLSAALLPKLTHRSEGMEKPGTGQASGDHACRSRLKPQVLRVSANDYAGKQYFPSRTPDGISCSKGVLHRALSRERKNFYFIYTFAVYIYPTVLSYANRVNEFPVLSKVCPDFVRTIFFL